ncbi:MAG: hypothetical protein HC925_04845 [Coleofasciculaceae cyanobacterium SM2_3_26]|nr:hypothetical protein [Coleofasciculaceae cyanobacterium SM2_3_26]
MLTSEFNLNYVDLVFIKPETDGPDDLAGDSADNTMVGLAGDDTLNGGNGDDTLIGGTGGDRLNGDGGNDTADYAEALSGIFADLGAGKASRIAKIMPLGDSITYGVVATNLTGDPINEQGGYRTNLWQKFVANGLEVDYVGNQNAPQPAELGDPDHEGIPVLTLRRSTARWITT